jgi:hypothetical protein
MGNHCARQVNARPEGRPYLRTRHSDNANVMSDRSIALSPV